MKLSIVVPVYNMAADGKLEFCIRSLLGQTLTQKNIPYEVIAVDDASTDNSLQVLKKLSEEDSRLKIIASPENHRQGGARNRGIKEACGEFIGMMDSDDWAAPDMFEKLLIKAEETKADIVGCDYQLVGEHSFAPGKRVQNNIPEQTGVLTPEKRKLLILQPGSMVVKIYRRDMITEHALWFPEDIFYEDNCMSSLWLLHGKQFERVDEPLYYYYQHEASTVHYISRQKCLDRVAAMELLLEKSKEYGFYGEFREEFDYKYTELAFVNTLFSCMGGRMKGKYRFVKELRSLVKKDLPDFADNPYYRERTGAEEQKLIGFLMKSPALFYSYYRLLNGYRRLMQHKQEAGT